MMMTVTVKVLKMQGKARVNLLQSLKKSWRQKGNSALMMVMDDAFFIFVLIFHDIQAIYYDIFCLY